MNTLNSKYNRFIDTGLDISLVKSMNKSNLVQVQRTVNGKHGQYSRMQWVRASEVSNSDRVISVTPASAVKDSDVDKMNSAEELKQRAKFHSEKFRKGTVVEATVIRDRKPVTITAEVVSFGFSRDKNSHEVNGTSIQLRDKHGNVYSINSTHPKAHIKVATKASAERFLGRKLYPVEYFMIKDNSSEHFTENQVKQMYRTKSSSDVPYSFDTFLKQNFFESNGLNVTNKFYKKDGEYIPTRQKLHDDIVQKIVDAASTPPAGSKPICFLFGGGSASGKSSVVNPIMKQVTNATSINFGNIDSDDIKNSIPEYAFFQEQNASKAAARVHDESSDIANQAVDEMIAQGKCFSFDGTMKNAKKYEDIINKLKSNGYEVRIIGVDIPLSDAYHRSDERAKVTHRVVPKGIITGSHIGFAKTFPQLRDKVDGYQLYDNSQPQGEPPTLICSDSGIANEELWNRFLQKGQIQGGHKHEKR